MMPEKLVPDRLYMFVIGPGFGESVVIRVPPDHWVVIDSCKPGERAAALEVLSRYSGQCACAILTHQHRDHYPGFAEILSHANWTVIGCADTKLLASRIESQNPEEHRKNELEDIMAAIVARWESDRNARWQTWRGTRKDVGEATLTSLHPTEALAGQTLEPDQNSLSTAILIEWKSVRLLLGADVENPHWDDITRQFQDLGAHAGMKVPHHGSHLSNGSKGSLHKSFLTGERRREWIVTPYSKGSKRPGFEDGEGAHQLLEHVEVLHLTGLPIRHDRQAEAPCQTTRADYKSGKRPQPIIVQFAGGLTGTAVAVNNEFRCYVGFAFDHDGTCVERFHGPGSIKMTEA